MRDCCSRVRRVPQVGNGMGNDRTRNHCGPCSQPRCCQALFIGEHSTGPLVQPARLKLALLDRELPRDIWIVAAYPLDETLGGLASVSIASPSG
jgi:hypothetical protein